MEKPYVWEFTNQKRLTKKEFIQYVQKKVFKTIRKYDMLPTKKPFSIEDKETLEVNVLLDILQKKFEVIKQKSPNFIAKSATEITEELFENITQGSYKAPTPQDKPANPLYFISDKELETYATLRNITGKKRTQNKKIESLLKTFGEKNQDMEQNILKALGQLENKK